MGSSAAFARGIIFQDATLTINIVKTNVIRKNVGRNSQGLASNPR